MPNTHIYVILLGNRGRIMKKLICIDFDGVLNNYSGQYDEHNLPQIKEGAEKFLDKLSEDFRIEIFTVRNIETVTQWLIKNNLMKYIENVTNIKNKFASVFLDDRALNFDGDFDKAYRNITTFKPYWKNI